MKKIVVKGKASEARPKVHSMAELARYLGLSDWTVSRAVNGHPAVKASTRERVLRAMQDVAFQPDPIARSLRGKETGLVGVCFNDPRNALLIDELATFDAILRRRNQRSVLVFTGGSAASEVQAIHDFRNLRVDAVVLMQSTLSAEQTRELLVGSDCKWVHVDPLFPQPTPVVSVDRSRGMEFLVDHLVALGHRRFGLLGIPEHHGWRWPGLIKALRHHRMDRTQTLQVFPPPAGLDESFEMGLRLAQSVLKEKNPPTALLAINDRVAIAAIQYLKQAGVDVPGDISVTGFDHSEMALYLPPTLTTIDQQPQRLMEIAADLLEQWQDSPEEAVRQKKIVKPTLVVGGSTGPVRSSQKSSA